MEKIYPFHPSTESSSSSASAVSSTGPAASGAKSDTTDYLRHLSKISHKISKPVLKKPSLDPPIQPAQAVSAQDPPPPPPPPPPQPQPQQLQNPHQHQPPVYNINKNDFRDVVQKLTGSPAHERAPAQPAAPPSPAVHAPKHPSSRLQRIRPPPLAHLSTRPCPSLNCVAPSSVLNANAITSLNPNPPLLPSNFNFPTGRPSAPLSPLPPLPSVHGAAESPVSAYMRHLQTSISAVDSKGDPFLGFRPLVSPRWSNLAPPALPALVPSRQPEGMIPPLQQQLPVSSPMPFGCSNSPRSPYGLISPGFLFSPTSLGFPLSPSAVPVPSPRSGGI